MLKKAVLMFLFFVAVTDSAWCGGGSGTVKRIMVHQGDIVMFSLGDHINKPACSLVGEDWALSLATEEGRAMYALLLSAAAQGHTVHVEGRGDCSAWGDRENPKFMWVDY